MLQGSPEVHGDGADLDFHRHRNAAFLQEHRDLDDEVEAPVAVGLGLLDVVPRAQQLHVILAGQQIRHGVHVLHIGADDADAGNVRQILHRALHADGRALPTQLFGDGLDGLHPALDVVDGIAPVPGLELVVEDFQLGLNFLHRGGIPALDGKELVHHPSKFCGHLLHALVSHGFPPSAGPDDAGAG